MAGCCTTEPDGQLPLRGARDDSKFAHAHIRGETSNDPAPLGSRVCAELLRQDARDIIEGTPH